MRSGAIILDKENKILLIHRFFQGREYYVFPGGGVEEGESVEEAVVREIKEETGLDAKINQKLFEFYNDFDKRINHFFLVTEFTGKVQLGGPEAQRNSKEDRYVLEWHKLDELQHLSLFPEKVKKLLPKIKS
jgi:mutator protein MutT